MNEQMIVQTLKGLIARKFSGRILLLHKENTRLMGEIYLSFGRGIQVCFDGLKNEDAITQLGWKTLTGSHGISYIQEVGVFNNSQLTCYSFEQFSKIFCSVFKFYEENRCLFPKKSLILALSESDYLNMVDCEYKKFLDLIDGKRSIQEIIELSDMSEFRIFYTMIKLRKDKKLLVRRSRLNERTRVQ